MNPPELRGSCELLLTHLRRKGGLRVGDHVGALALVACVDELMTRKMSPQALDVHERDVPYREWAVNKDEDVHAE
jgi:hypothetical protein